MVADYPELDVSFEPNVIGVIKFHGSTSNDKPYVDDWGRSQKDLCDLVGLAAEASAKRKLRTGPPTTVLEPLRYSHHDIWRAAEAPLRNARSDNRHRAFEKPQTDRLPHQRNRIVTIAVIARFVQRPTRRIIESIGGGIKFKKQSSNPLL